MKNSTEAKGGTYRNWIRENVTYIFVILAIGLSLKLFGYGFDYHKCDSENVRSKLIEVLSAAVNPKNIAVLSSEYIGQNKRFSPGGLCMAKIRISGNSEQYIKFYAQFGEEGEIAIELVSPFDK